MHFERLDISYFRNLSAVTLELNTQLNFFHGGNGAGKTAILEAAHLLVRGRSFRTHRANALVQHGSEALTVRGTLKDDHRGLQSVAMSKDISGRTELRVNGERERRLSVAASLVPLQVMLPDIAGLVFGGPALRRQWLDWGTFHVKPDYLRSLRAYLRALKQRNASLKRVSAGLETLESVEPWTQELLSTAAIVNEARLEYLEAFEPIFQDTLARLAPELDVHIAYRRGWPEEETLDKVLGEPHAREVKLGATQGGPHRADIELMVGPPASAVKATSVLSRGQGKAVASALKVGQASLLAATQGRGSVFLIDDLGAELDSDHNARFFELLREMDCQILATSTHQPARLVDQFAAEMINVFHVERGQVHRSPDV